uniref:Phlebovirus glycoprotein G2 fusion domain-containing protein n=1 Tax=Panagrellus redivivus TaxID=6233 RepID=A0A7E4UUA8_PANRE
MAFNTLTLLITMIFAGSFCPASSSLLESMNDEKFSCPMPANRALFCNSGPCICGHADLDSITAWEHCTYSHLPQRKIIRIRTFVPNTVMSYGKVLANLASPFKFRSFKLSQLRTVLVSCVTDHEVDIYYEVSSQEFIDGMGRKNWPARFQEVYQQNNLNMTEYNIFDDYTNVHEYIEKLAKSNNKGAGTNGFVLCGILVWLIIVVCVVVLGVKHKNLWLSQFIDLVHRVVARVR